MGRGGLDGRRRRRTSLRPAAGAGTGPRVDRGVTRQAVAGAAAQVDAAAATRRARPRVGRARARQAARAAASERDARARARSRRALARTTPHRGHSGVVTAGAPQRGQSMGRAVARERRRLYTNRLSMSRERERRRGDPVKTASTAREDRVGSDAEPGGRRAHEAGDGSRRRRRHDAAAWTTPAACRRDRRTILKDNISWHLPYLSANSTPWQLEGVVRTLREDGYQDLLGLHNQTVVTDAHRGDKLNKFAGVYRRYERADGRQLLARLPVGDASSRRRSCSSSTASSARCGCPR